MRKARRKQYFQASSSNLTRLYSGPETPEEVAKASKAIARNLKEDIDMRDADDISPEEDRVTKCFKKDGIWDSESSDKA